jgi:hypothetical protein
VNVAARRERERGREREKGVKIPLINYNYKLNLLSLDVIAVNDLYGHFLLEVFFLSS